MPPAIVSLLGFSACPILLPLPPHCALLGGGGASPLTLAPSAKLLLCPIPELLNQSRGWGRRAGVCIFHWPPGQYGTQAGLGSLSSLYTRLPSSLEHSGELPKAEPVASCVWGAGCGGLGGVAWRERGGAGCGGSEFLQ